MSKIIDIKILCGRREEIVVKDKQCSEMMMALAKIEFEKFKKNGNGNNYTIQYWAHTFQSEPKIKELFNSAEVDAAISKIKQTGLSFPEKVPEISLEKMILDALKDGYTMKGELVFISDKYFMQTMVKYEVGQSVQPINEDDIDQISDEIERLTNLKMFLRQQQSIKKREALGIKRGE